MSSGYDKLLGMLGDDEKSAADRYLLLRAKLILYFESRRISLAEDHADEALHRVAKKIEEGVEIRNISHYAFGVAHIVRLETYHHPPVKPIDEIENEGAKLPGVLTVLPGAPDDEDDAPMQLCIRKCLAELPDEKQKLLLDFYKIDESSGNYIEQRKRLARRCNLKPGAFYKQICLLRKKVDGCAHDCVKRELG